MQMSHGQDAHASPNHDLMSLKQDCLETFSPVFANTQIVESSAKDTAIAKSTGRDEETKSSAAMVRLRTLQFTSLSTTSDLEHTNRIQQK